MSKKFKSQDYFRYPRLGTKWRRPKGRQSKLREKKGGSGQVVAIGHRTSRQQRNTLKGLRFITVRSVKDLDGAKDAIIISASIGAKKTKIIAEKARQMNLRILNMKKVKKSERREKEIAKKKEEKKTKKQKEEAKKQEAKKDDKAKAEKKQEAKTTEKKEHAEKEKQHDGKKEAESKKMGFDPDVVPQVLDGKTSTYRIRDHKLKVGDNVAFENTQTHQTFGHAVITNIRHMKVRDINLKDPAHYKTYNTTEELVDAFRTRNPDKSVTPETDAYVYTYEFTPAKTAGQKSEGAE